MGGVAARPLGRSASAGAAVAGGVQEHVALGAVLGAGVGAWLIRRRVTGRPTGAPGDDRVALRLVAGAAVGLGTRFVWPVAPKASAAVAPHRSYTDLGPGGDGAGIAIVVNPGAGSGAIGSGPSPVETLRKGLPSADVVELDDGDDLVEALERAAREGCRALGVAGGDGSINAAAAVALEHGLPLVVVPAGTLNHLARDLGVETVTDAVDAVHSGCAAEIDVGWIAGRPFLNTASFGSYVELVDAREELEGQVGKWVAMAVALVRVLRHGTPVEVELDGERRTLWLAFLGNCHYQPEGMAPTWREHLDDGEIDVRLVDASHPFCRTRLVLAALTGTLRRSRVFETWHTTGLHVRSADGPLRLARDGETFDGTDEFDVVKTGARLAVFAPRVANGGT
jgi:diacylglycerol kinase family enzyme